MSCQVKLPSPFHNTQTALQQSEHINVKASAQPDNMVCHPCLLLVAVQVAVPGLDRGSVTPLLLELPFSRVKVCVCGKVCV